MSGPASGDGTRAGRPLLIVCAYPEGLLASSWHRAYKKVRQTVKRGSFDAHVELAPITALPAGIDVLIASPSLAGAAAATTIGEDRLIGEPDDVQAAFERLLARLVRDGRLATAPQPDRSLAVHRGFQALGQRAGLEE